MVNSMELVFAMYFGCANRGQRVSSQVTAMERSGTSNDDDMRLMLRLHALVELIKGLAESALLVSHSDERVDLVVYNCFCS